jgi:hypothetical protein
VPSDLLPSLLKAGGLAALSIGVVYLLYSEIIKLRVVPKLRQWQGFALLCLLAILVFAVAMTVLLQRENVASARDQLIAIAKQQDRGLYTRITNLVFTGTSRQCRELKEQIENFQKIWSSAIVEDLVPVTATQAQLDLYQRQMTSDYEQRNKLLDRLTADARTRDCL